MEVELDNLEIRDLAVVPSETTNSIDFRVEGCVGGLSEDKMNKLVGNKIKLKKVICEVDSESS
ncbi:hypothetical protein [Haloterrigena turkmenica]|uniref:hypothetical protein n=1 Tax=Haloterrigena turkmenica TaxID=62320 RepID=UPI0011D04B4C|nr:hypothetical protein [Haloterrigena turkmenica]